MLSLHPDVAKKLRAEVLDITANGPPNYADIRASKYRKPPGLSFLKYLGL